MPSRSGHRPRAHPFAAWPIRYPASVNTVALSESGRLTLPIEVRRKLGLERATQVEVELDGETIILRPAIVLRREDAWAYTPEHRGLLSRAHSDSSEGRVQQLTEAELKTLAA